MFTALSYAFSSILDFIGPEPANFSQSSVFSNAGPTSSPVRNLLGRQITYGGPSSPARTPTSPSRSGTFQETTTLIGQTPKAKVTIANEIVNGEVIRKVACTHLTLDPKMADATIQALSQSSNIFSPTEPHVTAPFCVQFIQKQDATVEALFFSTLRQNGNLDNYLGAPWTLQQRTSAMLGAAKGVLKVHEKGMLHRDIKPANLFVDEREGVSIGDFDRAISIKNVNSNTPQLCGTPPYWAPELVQLGADKYSPASDVWALGITFYQLHTGGAFPRFLQNHRTISDVRSSISELNDQLIEKTVFSRFYENREVEDTIRGMLSVDPFKRLPLDKVIENLSSILRSLDN